ECYPQTRDSFGKLGQPKLMADRGKIESPRGETVDQPRDGGLAFELAATFDFSQLLGVADALPIMIGFIDREERCRFVNEALADFTGLRREEARVLDWRDRIQPDDQERVVAESIAGEASLKPFTLEARYLRHDGEWRWLRSVSQPRFGADGALSGFIGVASDITEAKN